VVFEGNYFNLHGATLLPRPGRACGPRILIGGNGEKRTLPLAARYADEWNAVFSPPEEYSRLSAYLDGLLRKQGRPQGSVRRSLMTGLLFARNKVKLAEKIAGRNQTETELRKRGIVIGVGEEVKEQLVELEKAGVQRVMLQWLDLDDLSDLEVLAKLVL
jgi:alkanesulfonate monooxygenase SsuD/methylene tetrahydromethanopterin reductase-like flavin-dependent oxidoreductase (luciferase family)